MRILLAAITCPKAAPVANTEQHLHTLALAADAGCALAVFPEMSLTGSVDPVAHPDRTVTLDDPVVTRVVDATRDLGVGALFGIAEQRNGGFHISQVHATGGHVAAVQRKRVLGEDERGFAAASVTERFRQGHDPFGVIICAETHDDRAWDATAAWRPPVVFIAAAPGLHGRRTDEAGWDAGYRWWLGSGVADARRNAARLGVWVALATQAGPTDDEDFPGGAALIDPTGTVVDALPDRHPGTLIVDVPITYEGPPKR